MTELPALPPPPDRQPTPPVGGAARALAVGRSRRHRFLAGAGATTAVLVLGTTVLLGSSSSTDSLIAGDPEPTASTSAEPGPGDPTTTPPAQPAAPTGSPTPVGEPAPGASSDPSPVGAAEPERPEASPQEQAADDRDDYVEEPSDSAAPLNCTTTPPTQAGPVFTGGASACGYASGGGEVRQGGQATVTLGACQSRNSGEVVFGYRAGQEHEVVVSRAGREVWRFSPTVRYPQGAHERTVRDGRCLAWTGVWPTELADGSPAPEGRYEMHVITTVATVDGRAVAEEHQGSASASVDVVAG